MTFLSKRLWALIQRLRGKRKRRPHYILEELLACSDYSQPPTREEHEWMDTPPAGRELL